MVHRELEGRPEPERRLPQLVEALQFKETPRLTELGGQITAALRQEPEPPIGEKASQKIQGLNLAYMDESEQVLGAIADPIEQTKASIGLMITRAMISEAGGWLRSCGDHLNDAWNDAGNLSYFGVDIEDVVRDLRLESLRIKARAYPPEE